MRKIFFLFALIPLMISAQTIHKNPYFQFQCDCMEEVVHSDETMRVYQYKPIEDVIVSIAVHFNPKIQSGDEAINNISSMTNLLNGKKIDMQEMLFDIGFGMKWDENTNSRKERHFWTISGQYPISIILFASNDYNMDSVEEAFTNSIQFTKNGYKLIFGQQ